MCTNYSITDDNAKIYIVLYEKTARSSWVKKKKKKNTGGVIGFPLDKCDIEPSERNK